MGGGWVRSTGPRAKFVRGRGSFVGRDTILREDKMLVIKWKKDGWMDGRRTWAASGSVDISRDGTGWSRAEQAGTGERGRASLTTVPMNTGIGSF